MDRRSLLAAAGAMLATPVLAQTAETEAPTYEGVTFQSHDRTIRAIHYRPVGQGRRAGIVMMHGSGGRIVNRGPWHQLAMRFAIDGYQVLKNGGLRALVGGDVRHGGLSDLVSLAITDQRECVIARFAVIRRARQVARWR